MAANEERKQVSFNVSAADAEAFEALENIERELGPEMAVRAPGRDDLCRQYAQVRRWLETLLPWIRRIPGYGRQIATAIEFLMRIADTLCPS